MTLRTALRALRRNKLRSALTMLGIIIGVAAVIAMVSIGAAPTAAVQQQIASLGTNMLMVDPGRDDRGRRALGLGRRVDAHRRRRDAIAADVRGRRRGHLDQARRRAGRLRRRSTGRTSVQGVTADVQRRARLAGRERASFFTQRDEDARERVAVLGADRRDNLFGAGEDPIGAVIRIKDVPFQVIGVLPRKGQSSWGQDQDDVVMIPFSTAERRVLGAAILGSVEMIMRLASTAPRTCPRARRRSSRSCASATASPPRPGRRLHRPDPRRHGAASRRPRARS